MSEAESNRRFLLLSGTNDRAVMAFLRTAKRLHVPVSVVAMGEDDLVLESEYRSSVLHVRKSRALTMELFESWVRMVMRATDATSVVVYPSSEYLNTFLLANREAIERIGCIVPLPSASTYARLTNKESSTEVFAGHGIGVPRTYANEDVRPPVIAKPRRNVGGDGKSLYPHLISDGVALARFRKNEREDDFFFQQWVSGRSYYLFFHLPRGPGALVKASQENLLQEPDGKSMLLARPAGLHEGQLADRCMALLRDEGFHGLCMIEFIGDHDDLYFIELNPRPWGPIQFCEDMGAPVLAAFIADWWPAKVSPAPHRKRYYAWSGGLLKTLLSRRKVVTHGGARLGPRLLWTALRNDVYLRRDTWRCFFQELRNAISGVFHD